MRDNIKTLPLTFFLFVFLAACASPTPTSTIHTLPTLAPATTEPIPHGAPQATSDDTGTQVIPVWTAKLSDAVNTQPLLSGDLVIIATADGAIHAVNAETGKIAWQFSPQTKVWDASLQVDATRACAGMEGGQVVCLDINTGTPLWVVNLGLNVQSQIALTPDRVYAPTTLVGMGLENDYNGKASLFALDATTGEIVWEKVTDNYVLRRPNVGDGIVVTGGLYTKGEGDGLTRLYALSTEDGSEIWRYESDDGLPRWLEISDQTLLFSAGSETVHALNLTTGQLLWSYGPGFWMQFPAIHEGIVYFGTGDQILHAVQDSTGEIFWDGEINMNALNQIGRPIYRDGQLYFNAVTGEIYTFDAATGAETLHLVTGHTSRVGGALYQNLYLMGDPDGNLYAYAIP